MAIAFQLSVILTAAHSGEGAAVEFMVFEEQSGDRFHIEMSCDEVARFVHMVGLATGLALQQDRPGMVRLLLNFEKFSMNLSREEVDALLHMLGAATGLALERGQPALARSLHDFVTELGLEPGLLPA